MSSEESKQTYQLRVIRWRLAIKSLSSSLDVRQKFWIRKQLTRLIGVHCLNEDATKGKQTNDGAHFLLYGLVIRIIAEGTQSLALFSA